MTKWTPADIPDQSGRTHVVTGANSGLGQVIATELARAGANVVVACRDTAKGERAASAMPGNVEVRHLDLSDLSSVRAFAAGMGDIAVLVNNAGVMATPKGQTKDGFELQIGTNHLGHFALTGLLLGRIADRVVSMSSFAHRMGRIDLDDLNWERRRYQRWSAYGQSKLANLQFTYELQRQLTAAGSNRKALASHPGYAATNLQSHTDSIQDAVMGITNRLFAQTAEMGALPALYAATFPSIPGGSYVGPDGALEQRGHPKIVKSSKRSYDEATAAGLWKLSEELTGVTFKDL
ncbi:MAG TPA: oxidoreductase [Acidimicrobiales bacterium]|jgi:NAD(P)-dependent dehydrogenase (short-subunit alcohol dehydrogenase family)|nr:oxidoreductase [Acidimicrobiales bacterium]